MRTETAITEALRLLRSAGVTVQGGDGSSVQLVDPVERTLTTLSWNITSSASMINRRPEFERSEGAGVHELFVVPVASADDLALRTALDNQLNLVILDPPLVVIQGNSPGAASDLETPRASSPRRRGKLAFGRWAIERVLLLASSPLTQRELAQDTGITQQAVSHALTLPRNQGFVSQVPQGYFVPRRKREPLLDDWLAGYSGPRGIRTFWYGLQTPLTQGYSAKSYAEEMEVKATLSGDCASDVYAPWRTPTIALVYANELLDFTAVDLVPASRDDATLVAAVPRDHTLWATAASSGSQGLVDPIIALWDLTHAGGLDADQAAARLRRAVLDQTLP